MTLDEIVRQTKEVVDLLERVARKAEDAQKAIRAARMATDPASSAALFEGGRALLEEAIALRNELVEKEAALVAELRAQPSTVPHRPW